MSPKLALQSYTVRADLVADFIGTLTRMAEIGYRCVELHTLLEHDPAMVRDHCDRIGLKVISEMATLSDLAGQPEIYARNASILGNRHIVCPYIVEDDRTVEGYKHVASRLRSAARVLNDHGVTLCYHNHAFEFDTLADGRTGFDILCEQAFTQGVAMELDVYWVAHAGRDPLAIMERWGSAVPLVHLKDMAGDGSRQFREIGAGILPLQQIVDKAASIGVQYVIVEQDADWHTAPMASAQASFKAASKLLASHS